MSQSDQDNLEASPSNGEVLRVRDLIAGYGGMPVIHRLNLRISRGDVVSIRGSNGAGKSTLLAAISGVLRPIDYGSIEFDGRRIEDEPAHHIARSGLVHVLERRRLAPFMSVIDNLRLSLATVSRDGREAWENRLETYLSELPVLRYNSARLARHLSGGQQQLVAVVRGLLAGPTVLLLDEPFQGLDLQVVDSVSALLERVHDDGLTLVFTEHRDEVASNLAATQLILERGQVVDVADGN